MIVIAAEAPAHAGARERLLDRVFGPQRLARTCERLREGRLPASGLSLAAYKMSKGKTLIGTVRLWHIDAGGCPALLLGPLAVDPALQGCGIGSALMHTALARAAKSGHRAVVLVGDAPYYARFGFCARLASGLSLPGPFERERLLGLELVPDALAGANGIIAPTGVVAAEGMPRAA